MTACTQAALHRPESIEEKHGYTVTYIEFDDHGEPFAPEQLEGTIQVIDEIHNTGKRAVVLLFVHGWQNDASQRDERKKDNNVEGFQRLLDTARDLIDSADQSDDVELVGVYLGWRGHSTDNSLLRPLTFYSRRGAGQRTASVSTTEAILRVMGAAKKNPGSTGIVIGHSFGGMIAERAMAQAVVSYTMRTEANIQPTADMIILVNPASQSMQAKNLVSMLKRNRLKFYREDKDGNRREAPPIVSVTSTADTATGTLYPMALGMKGWSKKFREYESTDCSPAESQKQFYTQTAGHNRVLHSHVITTAGELDALDVETVLEFAEHVVLNARRMWSEFPLQHRRRMQKVLFPEGLVHDGEAFRTPVTCLFFRDLERSEREEYELVVLSGGAAASIYSDDRYQSSDMDFVTSERITDLVAALAPLGFVKGSDRHLTHPNSDYYVEFPPGPVAIGSSVITEWDQLETEFGTSQILSPTQMVMDRMAAYIHWYDPPSLDQAVLISQNHPLDWKALETWCAGRGGLEKYQAFPRAFSKAERAAAAISR